MARCGCQGGCSCAMQGSSLIQVGGSGAASDPFTVGLAYGDKAGCDAIAACVGDHLDAPLLYEPATGQIQIEVSQDPGNLVQTGSDGGLMVPTAGAAAGLVEGQAIDITGDQAAGYTIGARISSDPDNALVLGSDGGLYVRKSLEQQGVLAISFTNRSSYTLNVVFPVPFATLPVVSAFIASGAGPTARWGARAITVSLTGFTLFLFSGENPVSSATWAGYPVGWRATTT